MSKYLRCEDLHVSLCCRKLLYGIKHFNLNVQKGLKILQEGGFVDETPESVAKFLFRQERLSKKQIGKKSETGKHLHFLPRFYFTGKYLGSHEDFNKQVLKHFVQCHQFSHLLLVQALRQFLWSFRLATKYYLELFGKNIRNIQKIFQPPPVCVKAFKRI